MPTTTDKTYNGWTNYETWNVKLWMDNDQESYNYWRATTDEVVSDNTNEDDDENEILDKDAARYLLASLIKEFVEENNPLDSLNAGMYADLLGAAISDVNWCEIASCMIEDYLLQRRSC